MLSEVSTSPEKTLGYVSIKIYPNDPKSNLKFSLDDPSNPFPIHYKMIQFDDSTFESTN